MLTGTRLLQAFLDELHQRSIKTAINCDLSSETTKGSLVGFATGPNNSTEGVKLVEINNSLIIRPTE